MKRTDIKEKLSRHRDKSRSGEKLLQEVMSILAEDEVKENRIRTEIARNNSQIESRGNDFKIELLDPDKIYHSRQIKEICIIYRLRFLDSSYFKDALPYEAIRKTKHLEKAHGAELSGFKILAPGKAFVLKSADDPLLFAPIGNGYYYLIHKWGNDLHPLRRLMAWPWKRIENMFIFLVAMTLLITAILPKFPFPGEITPEKFLMIAFMLFPWVVGLAVFYFVKKGRNFSPHVWESHFFNG